MPKAIVAKSPIGIFAFSETGELLHYKLFKKENACNDFFAVHDDFLSHIKSYEHEENEKANSILRKRFREYALSLGFAKTEKELNEFLSNFGASFSKMMMTGSIGRDRLIIQASNALDDMTKISNVLAERLKEWFTLHYPETRLDQKELAESIIKYGKRENFYGFRASIGVSLEKDDEDVLKKQALIVADVYEQKKNLENYIKKSIKEIMPNISSLIEPLLAAKILALAGSLEKLSRMPASTIQLIGAEKALFRHLHKRGKSPKYGIIFNDPKIQFVNDSKKGKAARIISSKLMMAARIDFYSKRFEKNLVEEMNDELKKLKRA